MTQNSLTSAHSGHTPHGVTAPLTPMSLGQLLSRIAHEWETRKKIFDLPTARICKPDDEVDLGFEFLGRPCASPIGPAAGPHSQLAQNIVLSWLGGSRLLRTIAELTWSCERCRCWCWTCWVDGRGGLGNCWP